MRPLVSRLRAERDCKAKYSVSARARICGLSAAMRAIPTKLALGLRVGGAATLPGEIEMSAVAIRSVPPSWRLWTSNGYFRFLFAICQVEFQRNTVGPIRPWKVARKSVIPVPRLLDGNAVAFKRALHSRKMSSESSDL